MGVIAIGVNISGFSYVPGSICNAYCDSAHVVFSLILSRMSRIPLGMLWESYAFFSKTVLQDTELTAVVSNCV